jgi:hypothetical protein
VSRLGRRTAVSAKPCRRTFSATFFLVCIATMELEGVLLEEI